MLITDMCMYIATYVYFGVFNVYSYTIQYAVYTIQYTCILL